MQDAYGNYAYYDCPANVGIFWCWTSNVFIFIENDDHLTAISTAVIAIFTCTLFFATRGQGKLTERANEHYRVTERADVKSERIDPRTLVMKSDGPNRLSDRDREPIKAGIPIRRVIRIDRQLVLALVGNIDIAPKFARLSSI